MLPSKKQLFDGSHTDPASPYVPSNLCVLASLSARVGSIGENGKGGWYSYRASKAALNQIIKTLNIEMSMRSSAPTIALALHPSVPVLNQMLQRLNAIDTTVVQLLELTFQTESVCSLSIHPSQ